MSRLVAPGEAQRWAAEVLEDLTGRVLWSTGGARFDVFDALRSPLLLEGGRTLSRAPRSGDRVARVVRESRRTAWAVRRALQVARAEPRAPSNTDIVVVPRQEGHLQDLIPLARQLQRNGYSVQWLCDESPLASAIASVGHNAYGLRTPLALEAARRLAATAGDAAFEIIRCSRRLSSNGIALRATWLRVLGQHLWDFATVATGVVTRLAAVAPKLIVVGNPYSMEGRVAAMAGQALGIKTVALEHGSIFAGDPLWQNPPLDAALVWGDESKEALVACGVTPERIHVTGSVRLDGAADASNDKTTDILVATSGPGDLVSEQAHRLFVADLGRAARALPRDVRWVVKLHPKDGMQWYRDLPDHVVVTRGDRSETIYDHIRRARCLLTVSSTCAVESMALAVPVVAWCPPGDYPFKHVRYLDEALVHRTEGGDLATTCATVLRGGNDETRQHRVRQFADRYFANVGHVLPATMDALHQLMDSSPRVVRPAEVA